MSATGTIALIYRLILFGVSALPAIVPGLALAKGGGPLHLYGPFDPRSVPVVRAGIPMPSVSPSHALAGCGRGRYRDLKTDRCRGPADFAEPGN